MTDTPTLAADRYGRGLNGCLPAYGTKAIADYLQSVINTGLDDFYAGKGEPEDGLILWKMAHAVDFLDDLHDLDKKALDKLLDSESAEKLLDKLEAALGLTTTKENANV